MATRAANSFLALIAILAVQNESTAQSVCENSPQIIKGDVRQLKGHVGRAISVAFSPDSKRIATCGDDKSIRLWDVQTGKELLKIEGHEGLVTDIAFLPSGEQLVTTSWDKTARIWNLSSAKEIARFEGSPERLSLLAVSSDGQHFLTSGGDNAVRLWDIKSRKQISTFKNNSGERINGIALFPKGKKFLIAAGSELKVTDWETAKTESEKVSVIPINAMALSPDGKKIVISLGLGSDYTLELRSPPVQPEASLKQSGIRIFQITQPLMKMEGHRRDVNCLVVTSDGQRCLSGSGPDWEIVWGYPESMKPDNTVRLWDLATGKELARFEGHTKGVYCLAVSQDRKWAVSASADNTVRLWRLPE